MDDPHPERQHAMRLLHDHGIEAIEVVGVNSEEMPEAILYVTGGGHARTAFLSRLDGKPVCRDVPGFPASP